VRIRPNKADITKRMMLEDILCPVLTSEKENTPIVGVFLN
jgi:hypothetical protein